jgi:hypothetical protein
MYVYDESNGEETYQHLFYFHCLSSSIRKAFYTESNSQASEEIKYFHSTGVLQRKQILIMY